MVISNGGKLATSKPTSKVGLQQEASRILAISKPNLNLNVNLSSGYI